MSFHDIDMIAQCGEDIYLAVDCDRRHKMGVERAGWLHKRLSRWQVEDNGKLSTFKKPKRWRWLVIIAIIIISFLIFK